VSLLPEKTSDEFKHLYEEYESQQTSEAKIIKEFDRFDVMLQAFQYEQREYETKGRVIRFQEFFDSAMGKITSKQLVRMWDQLNEQRAQFWSKVQSSQQNDH
jgi:putative hydrolase of HD superfamily